MKHSQCALVAALTLSTVVAVPSVGSAANTDWDALRTLKLDQQIRVKLRNARLIEGAFQSVNNLGITLRPAESDQTLGRDDVLRVYSLRKNHRARNFAIGAGIGVALAALAVSANHWGENTGIRSTGWIWPVGVSFFGGIGAAIPTGGWHEVYRARKPQS